LNEFVEIATALADGTERLRSVSDSPMLDAELLLARAIDMPRTYLIAHPEDTLDPAAVDRYLTAIERRSAGMPIAYIAGEKEFWSMTLIVSPDTLVPRPETEVLVDQALQRIPDDGNFTVLDLGTGNGAIALAIAKDRPNCDVSATDISDAALAVARENANRHALPNVEFLRGDWTAPVTGTAFDMIVSNPPYVPSADPAFAFLAHEPRVALASGEDGLDAIRQISIEARAVIRQGGSLLVEHGDTQHEEVARILAADGWSEVRHVNDLAGKPRVTIAILESSPDRG
jgi:release factor glutamine methyltransferase